MYKYIIYICTEMAPSLEWKGQKQKSKHNGVPISRGKNKYRLRRCESIRTPYRTMHLNEAAGGFAGGLYEACMRLVVGKLRKRSSKRARSEEICLKVKWPSSPKCVCRKIRSVQAGCHRLRSTHAEGAAPWHLRGQSRLLMLRRCKSTLQ